MSDVADIGAALAATEAIGPAVRQVWNQVLGTRAADPERSILDMRIGAGRAQRLVSDIEAATGVALPITIVFQAPTCAALTAVVRSGVVPPPNPLVVIKPGDASPPLFIVPGLGATVFELFDLGRKIDCPGAVIACQPRGLEAAPPDRSVLDQARYLADAIASRLPAGPYRLLGYSYGGLVALETARMLRQGGGKVEFVGLLDTTIPEPYWPSSERLAFLRKRLKSHVKEMRGEGLRGAAMHVFWHIRPLLGRLRRMAIGAGPGSAAVSPFRVDGLPPALQRVRDANIESLNSHKMVFYDGEITLFNSADGDPLSCNPVNVWPRWVARMVTRPVPGAHETMMRGRHAGVLAASISAALRDIGAHTAQD
jgi:thioesterase domain-containing protein